MHTPNLAILIDGDNVSLPLTEQIMQFCKGYGILRTKNAHGDWKIRPLSAHCRKIRKLGVKLVQQNRDGKNSTDRSLKRDVDLMLADGKVGIYFIVSGDGDFTSTCHAIRQRGAQVFVIGHKGNTSRKLQQACTKFFEIEKIVKSPNRESTQHN